MLLICSCALICGFVFTKYLNKDDTLITSEQMEKLVFGLVKTTNFTKKTTILGYDKDLNLIVEKKYPFANVGDFSNHTTFNENYYFGQVAGSERFRDGNEILEVDLNDLSYKTYKLEKNGFLTIAENKEYVFGTVN